MLTDKKWEAMSDEKKYRFIKKHYEYSIETIANAIANACENMQNEYIGLSFSDNPWVEFKVLPNWHSCWTKNDYYEAIQGWLHNNYIELLWYWETNIGNPALYRLDKVGKKFRVDSDPINLDIPGLFRIS